MYKYGLKLWSNNKEVMGDVQTVIDDGIVDYLELTIVPGTYSECAKCWRDLDVPYVLHAPHSYLGLNLSQEDRMLVNGDLIEEVESYEEALNPMFVIFHPGLNGSQDETIRQINYFKKEHPEMFSHALIENKPKIGLNDELCLGYASKHIIRITNETGTGFCCDIGHAVCSANSDAKDIFCIIDEFIDIGPSMFHLSDGYLDSNKDVHLNYGNGDYPLKSILAKIPDGSLITAETKNDFKKGLADYTEDLKYLRGITG
jgi:deoxyribonuclease IV